MIGIFHFLRLVRFVNLLVAAMTMVIFQIFITRSETLSVKVWYDELLQTDFIFLVISTLLIMASGNIINDYFDVKADRVNKPHKLVVGKHLKRRWVIIMNWAFNFFGITIAGIIAYLNHNIWMIIIPFVSINFLWFYSLYYKRKFLIGNLMVASLAGVIPIFVYLFNFKDAWSKMAEFNITALLILIYSVFAFITNLSREIIKDMADVRGDLKLKSSTIPIKLGLNKTKIIASVLIVFTILPLLWFVFDSFGFLKIQAQYEYNFTIFFALVGMVVLCLLASFFTLIKGVKSHQFNRSSNLIKLAMFFGLLTPIFL